jgi:hypothetical protein
MSKANLKRGFLVLDISGTPLRVRKTPGLSNMAGVGRLPDGAAIELIDAWDVYDDEARSCGEEPKNFPAATQTLHSTRALAINI